MKWPAALFSTLLSLLILSASGTALSSEDKRDYYQNLYDETRFELTADEHALCNAFIALATANFKNLSLNEINHFDAIYEKSREIPWPLYRVFHFNRDAIPAFLTYNIIDNASMTVDEKIARLHTQIDRYNHQSIRNRFVSFMIDQERFAELISYFRQRVENDNGYDDDITYLVKSLFACHDHRYRNFVDEYYKDDPVAEENFWFSNKSHPEFDYHEYDQAITLILNDIRETPERLNAHLHNVSPEVIDFGNPTSLALFFSVAQTVLSENEFSSGYIKRETRSNLTKLRYRFESRLEDMNP